MTHTSSMLFSFFILSFGLVASLVILNYRRFTKLHFELEPNILLTRYPLMFVPGRRSLVYFLHYWNQIPEYLAAHGFEVYTLPLPWRNSKRRVQALRKSLEHLDAKNQRFHMIVDSQTAMELEEALQGSEFKCVASITSISDGASFRTSNDMIEEVTIAADDSTGWKSALWQFHNLITDKAVQQKNAVGWEPSLTTMKSFLSRAQHLAERDLIKNS